jgi:V/A-type H+/Na+-transporting ATPase subunit G/H
MRAENLARAAEEERERTIHAATAEARSVDEGFSASIPSLQQTWNSRAEERATTTIAEVERRYDERHQRLRDVAEEREDEALGAAFRILMDSSL